jgi:hypothetical protein
MIAPRYLAAFAIGIVLWCGLFLAFTWVIDPYGVSPLSVSINRVNKFKPKRLDIDRLIKPYEVWRYQPKTVFLGTSRIHQSLDPAVLDGSPLAPAYNASIPASSLGLNISHLRQYIELDPQLRTVVVELFLYNFLGQGQEHPPKDFQEYLRNSLNLFISSDALWASVQTFGYNYSDAAGARPVYEIKAGGYFYYPPGHNAKGPFDGYPAGIWKLHETRATGMKLHQPAFDAVREIIELCREHKLELILVLTPNHAYDDYYIEAIGAWDTVQEWLTRLSAEPATFYSFSQPNAWVYEPVSTQMRYWNDPYHFSLEMGRGMLESLAGKLSSDVPQNFALRLTPDNVAEHVAGRRNAIRQWARENPDFVARLAEERQKWEKSRGGDAASNPPSSPVLAPAPKKIEPVSGAVEATLAGLAELRKNAARMYPKASIKAYREVTLDLIRAGAMPAVFVPDGTAANPWSGKVIVQLFPEGAWQVGIGQTTNIVIESIPKKECSELMAKLGAESDSSVYKINLEPSGKAHMKFPIAGDDGCLDGVNNIGYTTLAY